MKTRSDHAPKPLPASKIAIFFLHGYGSSGENMDAIAQLFKQKIAADVICVCPSGYPQSHGYDGYEWFPLPDLQATTLQTGLLKATPDLVTTIQTFCNKNNVLLENVAVFGFSQGAMLALSTLFYDLPIGAILAYSGGIYPLPNRKLTTTVPVLWVHGDTDTVVDVSFAHQGADYFKQHNIPYDLKILENLEHTVDIRGIEAGVSFIRHHLPALIHSL